MKVSITDTEKNEITSVGRKADDTMIIYHVIGICTRLELIKKNGKSLTQSKLN